MKITSSLFRFALPSLFALATAACTVSTVSAQATATLTILHRFTGDDGTAPYAGLTFGVDGNLYGSTSMGISSANNGGTIFKITLDGVLTTLHSTPFLNSADGAAYRSELAPSGDGNFYGTAETGGAASTDSGTVFKITPNGDVTRIVSFGIGNDGENPEGALTLGRDGNFYGTTYLHNVGNGTIRYYGTVFKLTPDGVRTTLHRFTAETDGADPSGTLCLGSDGNFYGVTSDEESDSSAGGRTYGTVFKITPDGVLTTLHRFTLDGRGNTPRAGLVEGTDGYFYGTTADQFSNSQLGTVFKISPDGAFTMLHQFVAESDGAGIYNNTLIRGTDGKLYGTTVGARGLSGSVYTITADGQLTTLYTFTGGTNGAAPVGRLLQANDGSFYGVTNHGGASDKGTVYHLTLPSHPAFFAGEVALGQGVYYLAFPANGNIFGYYQYLSDPKFVYHYDLGFEYVFDLGSNGGVVFYDFASNDYFYTSPSFGFPYLYDFGLQAFLYYYPDPTNPQRYNTNGVRYFYNFNTGQVISK